MEDYCYSHELSTKSIPPYQGDIIYTIKPEDTIYKISMGYNISINDIVKANPNLNPYDLKTGDNICIPMGR